MMSEHAVARGTLLGRCGTHVEKLPREALIDLVYELAKDINSLNNQVSKRALFASDLMKHIAQTRKV